MQLFAKLVLGLCLASSVLAVRHAHGNRSTASNVLASQRSQGNTSKGPTFVGWYDAYSSGRGIWKWKNALEAYQTHFERYQTEATKFSIIEIGVQSGGSIDMFKAVLGANCHYYGCDINPKCTNFADAAATITIMDQGDANHWLNFYATVVPTVDMIVDDGGHQPHQMLTTLQQSFAHINPGGVHLVEDIHGQNGDYDTNFFGPAGDFLGAYIEEVGSVHLYPFVLVVQKVGGSYVRPAAIAPAATFDTVEGLVAAMPSHLGKVLQLKNTAWPPLTGALGLKALFTAFYELHGGQVTPYPANCFDDTVSTPDCTMYVSNTALQSLVTKVDIFNDYCQVFVAAAPPQILATRKGTDWIPYEG